MAAIIDTVEIERPPEEVFAYIADLRRHGEWQEAIISTDVTPAGATRVGTRALDKRRMPGGVREVAYEITEHDPPRRISFRGTSGPHRPIGTVTVEPLDRSSRSKITLEFDVRGRGLIGVLFAPFARASARKEVPASQRRLKEILERNSQDKGQLT